MEKRMPVIGKAWLKDENEITQWITSKEAEKYRTENWSKGSASDWESGEQINFNELSRKMPGVYDALKHCTAGWKNGRRVMSPQIEAAYETGQMPPLLPMIR